MFESYSSSIVINFGISCYSSVGIVVDEAITAKKDTEYKVQSLQPFSTYTCCVVATTSVGSTPTTCHTVQTMEDSKYTVYIRILLPVSELSVCYTLFLLLF